MERITSLTNPKVKYWVSLKEKKNRDKDGVFVVEEAHLIEEAFKNNLVEVLILLDGFHSSFVCSKTFIVAPNVMQKLSNTVSLNKQIAVIRKPKPKSLGSRIIMLDDVQDPGNVGTIIRLAYALGFDSVILSPACADPYGPKTVRSSQGALFDIGVQVTELNVVIQQLKERKIVIFGTALKNSKPLDSFINCDNLALIFGNEGQGIKPEHLAMCDYLINIPMSNFESLNVAVSAGIVAYHFRK